MGIFARIFGKKTIDEMEHSYKEAKMQSEALEIYQMTKVAMEKGIKETDQLQSKLTEIQRKKDNKKTECDNIKAEMKAMRKKHKIKGLFSRIPFIGRIPEVIGNIGHLPVIRHLPILKRIGDIGQFSRKYHRLKTQLQHARDRRRVYERNEKDLAPLVAAGTKQIEEDEKQVRSCIKAVRESYKLDKPDIELATMFETRKVILDKTFDKKSMQYITKYVRARQKGKEFELPEDIKTSEELLNKVKEGIGNRMRGEDVEELKVDNINGMNSNNSQNRSNFRVDLNRYTEFANSTINRDIVDGMGIEVNGKDGKKQTVSASDFMAFLGYFGDGIKTNDPIKLTDEIVKEMNDQSKGYVAKGLKLFEYMVSEINEGHVDINKTQFNTEGEKQMYEIAQEYVDRFDQQIQKNRAAQQQRGNNPQQQVI